MLSLILLLWHLSTSMMVLDLPMQEGFAGSVSSQCLKAIIFLTPPLFSPSWRRLWFDVNG